MKLPRSYYNIISFIGTALAIISVFMIVFFVFVGMFYEESNTYLGLFTFIILPVFLVIGLILIPIGMIFERKKRRKREKEFLKKGWPVIDLNVSRYRNAVLIFSVGSVFFLFMTSIGSYEAFHYTESVEFCGTVCHEVMKPEYTAYQKSPHARVACVDCHVGTGADWYVRSKLSGLRQVYAVLTDDFSRPISTPLHNLRPARETCERCHWPEKFYSRQLRNTKHFLTDSANTEWNISLQMNIGPEHSALGLSEGIHWHINPDVKIEYIPREDNRESIPWVKYTNVSTGEERIYQDSEEPLDEEKISSSVSREMDCMDCHNRPSHLYRTPQEFIDHALTSGEIPKELPYIKQLAMELFVNPYSNTDSAILHIREATYEFYNENAPELMASHKKMIDQAIEGMIYRFEENIFPEMGASWDVYTSHIGHKTYNGCFRCHNDTHESKDGHTISKDCNVCHTIVMQGKPGEEMFATLNDKMEFIHPKKMRGDPSSGLCSECHRYLY